MSLPQLRADRNDLPHLKRPGPHNEHRTAMVTTAMMMFTSSPAVAFQLRLPNAAARNAQHEPQPSSPR